MRLRGAATCIVCPWNTSCLNGQQIAGVAATLLLLCGVNWLLSEKSLKIFDDLQITSAWPKKTNLVLRNPSQHPAAISN